MSLRAPREHATARPGRQLLEVSEPSSCLGSPRSLRAFGPPTPRSIGTTPAAVGLLDSARDGVTSAGRFVTVG